MILTSNVGAEFIDKMESIGFEGKTQSKKEQYGEMKRNVEKSLKDHFRPEFLNRLDDIVIFDILSEEAIKKIVGIQIDQVKKRMEDKGINLKVSVPALNYLSKKGYDPHYGARPLKRLIQNKILNPLASLIISNGLYEGGNVNVSVKNEEFIFSVRKGKKTTSYTEKEAYKKSIAL